MTPVMAFGFEQQLDQYADLAIRVGVNVQPGQRLMIRSPVAAAPFVRRLVEHGYRAGSPLVDVEWSDEAVERARFRHAPDGSFAELAAWRYDARIEAARRGDALITILADDPYAFEGIDPERIATALRARQRALRPYSEITRRDGAPWALLAVPVPTWARAIFHDRSHEEATAELWRAVLETVRCDRPGARERWDEHLTQLAERRTLLNARRYRGLHFRGPGTDLTVGLAEGHRWEGGISYTPEGTPFVANLPTEEVYTAPHRNRVDGVVTSTKPLAHNGRLIEDLTLTFERGVVVRAEARRGEAALHAILDTDEGSRRLGEVALVPHSSPIAQRDHLFLETLFDENASCHVALGEAYRTSVEGGPAMSDDEARAAGLNDSLTHVDFMIGSAETDIDGLLPGGGREPLLRAGEWATAAATS